MTLKIKEQPNVFDDAFLDVIGNEFRFDHVKGLAEWIKNSADAYTRCEVPDAEQIIYLRFQPKAGSKASSFACIDFVGMSKDDIDLAFKRWGDRRAAARGSGKRMLGGHGNGGKFYMRQMFKESYFITYKDGVLNVFGFNAKKKYGYAEGHSQKRMPVPTALAFAELSSLVIPKTTRERWAKTGVGFTVVVGDGPERLKSWSAQLKDISTRLKVHPQSRRLVKYKQIYTWTPSSAPNKLSAEVIAAKPGFSESYSFELPPNLEHRNGKIPFRNRRYPAGSLTIWTSAEPFGRMGERSALNSIDILGEAGCIGSYRMNELGYLKHAAQAEFLYGECECPILEDPEDDCVRNDREKLVETDRTEILLMWIRDRVDEVAAQIAAEESKERKHAELKDSSILNQLLDKWKNRFMGKIFAEVFSSPGDGDGFGGTGTGGESFSGHGVGSGDGKRKGGEGDGGGGGAAGDKARKAPKFPRVLLSDYDIDPTVEGVAGPLQLDPRHPTIYQRPEDLIEGIYWINTSRPLARRIISQYGVKSTRWREYLFQRYVDIILKEAVYQLAKRDPEFTAEKVDSVWDKVQSRVHDAAADDLEAFLFEEAFMSSIAGDEPTETGLDN